MRTSRQRDDSNSTRKTRNIVVRIVVVVFVIIVAIFVFMALSCWSLFSLFGDRCQASPNLSIWVGGIIGAITTASFFLFVELAQKDLEVAQKKLEDSNKELKQEISELLEKYGRAYYVRTYVLALKDVFKGKTYQVDTTHVQLPNDETRRKFVEKLSDHYLEKFNVRKGEVREIHDLASKHPEIHYNQQPNADHNYQVCPYCRESNLVGKIEKYLEESKNPLLE